MGFETIQNKIDAMMVSIRTLREKQGYSQLYVATKLNISQNAYSKVELGQTKITLDTLFALAEILNLQVLDLLNSK